MREPASPRLRKRLSLLVERLRREPGDIEGWCELGSLGVRQELEARDLDRQLRDRRGFVEALRRAPDEPGLLALLTVLAGVEPASELVPPVYWCQRNRVASGRSHLYDPKSGLPLLVRRVVDGALMDLVDEGPDRPTSREMIRSIQTGVRPPERRLPGFWMDRFPVTVARYWNLVEQGACPAPLQWDRQKQRPDRPVTGISLLDAFRYAERVRARIPRSSHWLQAATSGDERPYPWGEEGPSLARALHDPRPRPRRRRRAGPLHPEEEDLTWDRQLLEVGTRPEGRSPFGLHDMLGLVAEYVHEAGGLHLLAGGSWQSRANELRVDAFEPLRQKSQGSMRAGIRLLVDPARSSDEGLEPV